MKTAMASRWRRVPWKALLNGQPVRLSQDGRLIGSGTVDGTTPDGSIIWVVLDESGERRMFHWEDYVRVEIEA